MEEMIIRLNHLLWEGNNDSIVIPSHQPMTQANDLIQEILSTFGLPIDEGFEDIMAGLGKTKEVSTQVKDEILIKLADEGVYYQALAKLNDI